MANKEVTLILGPPGTGKTTKLLGLVETFMEQGISPNRIAYVSFTRKAANEAVERAMKKFNLPKTSFRYFKTLHSICYHELSLTKSDIMQGRDYKAIGIMLGLEFTGYYTMEEGLPTGSKKGDQLLFIDSLSRAKCYSPRETLALMDTDLSYFELEQFSSTLLKYKQDKHLMDYTDMLSTFSVTCNALPVDIAIIDEAQDLSTLQWKVARRAFSNAQRVFIAGDDDQAIYNWSGADVKYFLAIEAKQEILNQSWRLPVSIYNVANTIAARIQKRYPKVWHPREDQGKVLRYTCLDEVDLREGEWLLLTRNNYQLADLIELARSQGVYYSTKKGLSIDPEHIDAIRSWERLRQGKPVNAAKLKNVYKFMKVGKDIKMKARQKLNDAPDDSEIDIKTLKDDYGLMSVEPWYDAFGLLNIEDIAYYRQVFRSGEKITEKPRVIISTIHGAKGGEADNVVIVTDISYKCFKEADKNPDDESRVFYVGVSRARENLHIIAPQTSFYYDIG